MRSRRKNRISEVNTDFIDNLGLRAPVSFEPIGIVPRIIVGTNDYGITFGCRNDIFQEQSLNRIPTSLIRRDLENLFVDNGDEDLNNVSMWMNRRGAYFTFKASSNFLRSPSLDSSPKDGAND